jgi:hypothetical protein
LTTDRLLQTPAQTTPSVDDEDTAEVWFVGRWP